MSLDQLPFNWFDVLLGVVLIVGIQRGRKRGMSEEFMSLLMWLAIVFVCAAAYQPLGSLFSDSSLFSLLTCYLVAYVVIGLVVGAVFAYLKRALGGKLLGSDVFGRSEFYLGMVAGMVRFACMLIAALALLNAPYYSAAQLKAETDYQNDVYGSTYFPTLCTVQAQVFNRSLSGPWIRQELAPLLIKPTTPEHAELRQKNYVVP